MSMLQADQADHVPLYRKLNSDLQEIRLLVVGPRSRGKAIRCSFAYTYLTDQSPEKYETISYVWGDENVRGSVILNGVPTSVPASTEAVIDRVRYRRRTRVIWIDSLCINQEDLEERASQVMLMAEIYSKTALNIIWLGEDIEGINEKALASIESILKDADYDTLGFVLYAHMIYENGQFRFSDKELLADVDWDAYKHYMSSTWFTRLWVVQEASLAPESVCLRGKSELPLDDVLRAACWVAHKRFDVPRDIHTKGYRCALSMSSHAGKEYGRHRIWHSRGARTDHLNSLISDMGIFNVRDERDYIYGMLGLYRMYSGLGELPGALLPNYVVPYHQLFRDVTRLVISRTRNLAILRKVYRQPGNQAMPSWVYRFWTEFDEQFGHHIEPRDFEAVFAAADHIKADLTMIEPPVDPNVLTLKGFRVSRISWVSNNPRKDSMERGAAAIVDLLDTADEMLSQTGELSTQQRLQTISHTLCYGLDAYLEPIKEAESLQRYTVFSTVVRESNELPLYFYTLLPTDTPDNKTAAHYWKAVLNSCESGRIFVTDAGNLGIAPLATEIGDLVVILFGSAHPMLLRPVADSTSNYELVGHSYVYGIMHGEAVDSWRASREDAEIFNLV